MIKAVGPIHPLKWGPLPPNAVSRIAQHVRKRYKERRKERGRNPRKGEFPGFFNLV